MPVLAVGGEKSFGPTMAVVMRAAADDVSEFIVPAVRALADGRAAAADRWGYPRLFGEARGQVATSHPKMKSESV